MTITTTHLYSYLNIETNKAILSTSIEIDMIDKVIQDSLYTLKVAKVVKRGYQDNDDQFIITTYYLESETV
jgi:hypothetical protein